MDSLGTTIRKLRKEKQLPLRTVAAYLDIDQSILSQIERGQHNASRGQVVKLARYFNVEESDLLISWFSDKMVYGVADKQLVFQAIPAAEEKIQYRSRQKSIKSGIISRISTVLEKDGRVAAAWLFGSFARDEDNLQSDVDVMVELNDTKKYSMFDLLDIAFIIENAINRKVDLVEKDCLSDFAKATASNDLIKIYG